MMIMMIMAECQWELRRGQNPAKSRLEQFCRENDGEKSGEGANLKVIVGGPRIFPPPRARAKCPPP